jgi:uncharacterized protein YjbI with pentapeptide repeats
MAKTTDLAALKETLDRSSEINRTLGLSMVAFLFYLLITIGSILDVHLLMLDKGVELPIIGITLPIIDFIWVTPIIITGIHLNTLLNLQEHSNKLNHWIEANRSFHKKYKHPLWLQHQLHPFLFNYTHTRSNTFIVLLSQVLVSVFAFFFPLLVLLYMEFRFADLHSFAITRGHFFFFAIDATLVWIFYKPILHPTKNSAPRKIPRGLSPRSIVLLLVRMCCKGARLLWRITKGNKVNLKKFILVHTRQLFDQCAYWFLIAVALLYLFIVHLMTTDKYPVLVAHMRGEGLYQMVRLYVNPQCVHPSNAEALLEEPTHIPIPRITVHSENLSLETPDPEIILLENERGLSEEDVLAKYTKGINLAGRNLLFAQFGRCELVNVEFSNSILAYAKFDHCNMASSTFNGTDLYRAEFWFSILNQSDFRSASMELSLIQHSPAMTTDFTGADLTNARFSSEVYGMGSTLLTGANFWEANLRKAQLDANLLGALFSRASFDSTDINGDLCGASFLTTKGILAGHFDVDGLYCETEGASAIITMKQLDAFTDARIKLLTVKEIPIRHLLASRVYTNPQLHEDFIIRHNKRLYDYCVKNNLSWRLEELARIEHPYNEFEGLPQ